VLARLSDRIQAQRREVDKLKRDEKRLAKLIEGLGRIVARPKGAARPQGPALRNERTPDAAQGDGAFAQLKGRLSLPTRGELANRFGTPRQEGGTTWKGIFIRAQNGAEVKAIAPGRIVFADWLRGFGNLAIVDHGDGYLSVYGNNESLFKAVGQPVKPGETIASVGNSGGNPETGLYFELRHLGQPLDPLKWVSLK
jgi:septal ring factor EnvC (AmiA/AmiB activator)